MKFDKFYKLLVESPAPIILTIKHGKTVKDEGINLQAYTFMGELFGYDLFVQIDGSVTRYYLLDKSRTDIMLSVVLHKLGKYQTVNSSWKAKDAERGLMSRFFKEFLIPKYHVLESGNLHTEFAKQFWINFIKNNIDSYKISFVQNGHETRIDNLMILKVEIPYIWKYSTITLRIYGK